MEEIDGDAPAQQKQLRERQRPPDIFTNACLGISVSTGSYSLNQDRPIRRVMTVTRVTRQERRERSAMTVGNASLSLLFIGWVNYIIAQPVR